MKIKLSQVKVALAAACCILSAPSVFAVVGNGVAKVQAFADPTITEDAQVDFGLMPPTVGGTCVINTAGVKQSGTCLGTQVGGQFTISGLQPTSGLLLTVTGANSAGNEVTFTPAASATDGTTTVALANGVGQAFTTTAGPANIVVTVGGTMAVNTLLTALTSYTVTYTLAVVYQ